jgi:hypothetical protein
LHAQERERREEAEAHLNHAEEEKATAATSEDSSQNVCITHQKVKKD